MYITALCASVVFRQATTFRRLGAFTNRAMVS
jgi:hypothetical protein